jgi:SAM-dependent methyltransferase
MDRAGGYSDYGFVAEFYDQVPVYSDRPDVAFFVELARECGGPVLELGSGTGRVLLPTARAGAEIVGLDLSPWMLDACRRKLAGEAEDVRARVRLVQEDMTDFHLDGTFPLVTIPFRAFQHLITVEEQRKCLECVRAHLAPGGTLVLDLFNPSMPALVDEERMNEWGDEPEFVMPDGRKVLRRFRVVDRDWNRQVQDVEMVYYVEHPEGRKERLVHSFPMRYLFRYEAEHLLERCGFAVETVYAGYAKEPFGSVYPGDLVFLARKRA